FQRASFSNEAGIGSAPIAHSAVKTKHPASEGLVALLEPFIASVIVCTMTALPIVIAAPASWDAARQGENIGGVTITSDAFGTVMPWFPHLLTVAVLLFAFSTILTWGYYGLKSWTYLFGRSKASEMTFKVTWGVFVIAGSLLSLDSLISLADSALFLLAVFNIIGLYLLAPVVKRELNSFLEFVCRRESGQTADARPEKKTAATKSLCRPPRGAILPPPGRRPRGALVALPAASRSASGIRAVPYHPSVRDGPSAYPEPHADHHPGALRPDRRPRPRGPPHRGVRSGGGAGGLRPPGALHPHAERRRLAHVLRVRLQGPAAAVP